MEKVKELKILPSYKEDVYVVKEDKENVLDSHQRANHADQIKINRRKSMRVTISQYETSSKIFHFFSVIIYPLEKKFIGTSSILHEENVVFSLPTPYAR